MKLLEFVVEPKFASYRLDRFLCENINDCTRSHLQKLIKDKKAIVNNQVAQSSFRLKIGEIIKLEIPDFIAPHTEAQHIPLDIVFEDEDMLIVNKPQGMVVHPAAGNHDGTLVNALLHHCGKNLSGINGVLRPGILHRIDKDTSGLILVAKTNAAHLSLSAQISSHIAKRQYKTIVHGIIKENSGSINIPIGRHKIKRKTMSVNGIHLKSAVTHYNVIKRFRNYTYLKCTLETGRTHQIRVHMNFIGNPILGDKTYGVRKEKFKLPGQLLHAYKIGFMHPKSNKYMEFAVPLPIYFKEIIDVLTTKEVLF